MNKATGRFLSLCVFMISLNSFADFSQTQKRYLSYFDIVGYFQKIEVLSSDCKSMTIENSVVFGYSSPITGGPVSSVPNFDFLNYFLNCISNTTFSSRLSKYLDEDLVAELSMYSPAHDQNKLKLLEAIDEMTKKIIGPEIVLVSYGHIKSQKEFRELIHNSAIEMLGENDNTTQNYLKKVFILIHLRDEFLSY
jgi:hypothetical protein